jgi:hypothetical protein
LAREAAAEKINGAESPLPVRPLCAFSGWLIGSGAPRPFRAKRDSNIIGSVDIGPVTGEDALAEGVDFALEGAGPSGSFESEVKAAHSAEEGAEGWHSRPHSRPLNHGANLVRERGTSAQRVPARGEGEKDQVIGSDPWPAASACTRRLMIRFR